MVVATSGHQGNDNLIAGKLSIPDVFLALSRHFPDIGVLDSLSVNVEPALGRQEIAYGVATRFAVTRRCSAGKLLPERR
jgi:hypothetical protein